MTASEVVGKVVVVHTDGACSPNPGPGGWGAILRYGDAVREIRGGEAATTNNRMELMAAIQALEALTRPSQVVLHTDSVYVKSGIQSWIVQWKRNGWITSSRQPVKNADLWQRLDAAIAQHDVEWLWVKGHSGDPGNERADELAGQGMRETIGDGPALVPPVPPAASGSRAETAT